MTEQRVNTRRNIIWLGLVSLFNDLSSEVIARILPLYLIMVVRTTFVGIGVVEAISEATSIFGKLFSGYYSDKFSRRKPMILLGYAVSVVSRPLILVSPTLGAIASARFLDKVGKSIRTPSRDALIADFSTAEDRGLNFGINRSLDTLGAVLGLASVAVYVHYAGGGERTFKAIIVVASFAGLLALAALLFGVNEPPRKKHFAAKRFSLSLQGMAPALKRYLWIAGVLTLANSSDAFIIVRARELGFSYVKIFVVLTGFNVVAAASGYYLGKLSDVWGRKIMLIFGWTVYALSYMIFGQSAAGVTLFLVAVICYGLYYGFTEGVEKALVADLAQGASKGQAYGWLGVVQGLCVIPANLIFAEVYQRGGAAWAFGSSASFALIGIFWLLFFNPATLPVAGDLTGEIRKLER